MNKTLIILILALIFIAIVTGAVISRKPTAISPSTENRTEIPGLVLPHHDLAQGIIINTVKKLAEIQPDIKYIAVLSPNHYRPESDTFTSAMILKNFPIATDKIEAIQNAYPRLVMDEKLLDREHG